VVREKIAPEDTRELHYERLRDYGGVLVPLSGKVGRCSTREHAVLIAETIEAQIDNLTEGPALLAKAGFQPYGYNSTDLWHQEVGRKHFIVKLGATWVSLTCDQGRKHTLLASAETQVKADTLPILDTCESYHLADRSQPALSGYAVAAPRSRPQKKWLREPLA
jgi:hypothetical protein